MTVVPTMMPESHAAPMQADAPDGPSSAHHGSSNAFRSAFSFQCSNDKFTIHSRFFLDQTHQRLRLNPP
jgi:hypothetical protein